MRMNDRAFEPGNVTEFYREVAPPWAVPLLNEFEVHVIRTGELSDSMGGLLKREPMSVLRVRRGGDNVFSPMHGMPRDVWNFLRGIAVARSL